MLDEMCEINDLYKNMHSFGRVKATYLQIDTHINHLMVMNCTKPH